MHIHEKLYINGQWTESRGTDKIQVIDPSTEGSVARCLVVTTLT